MRVSSGIAASLVLMMVACRTSTPAATTEGGAVAAGDPPGQGGAGNDSAVATMPDASGGAPTDAASGTGPTSGLPALGAHVLTFQRYHSATGAPSVSTPPIVTASGGASTIVISVGRGAISAFARPTDNKNPGPFPQLGATQAYTQYPTSGTALYALTGAQGGSGHIFSTTTPTDDEVTLAAVEVTNGKRIQDFKWSEVLSGNPLTSLSVVTTGPATLVAFWWGDSGSDGQNTAVPNNGFTVIDSLLQSSNGFVQCAVATKTVSLPGTYNVTWTPTPVQGAQLWLVAVQ